MSFPFVPGHEVVGVLDAGGTDHAGRPLEPGTRAVIEPVLGCAPRHIRPLCPQCAAGHTGLCGNVAFGDLDPGLQTGFCADTGGGWSHAGLVAHASQLHAVPDHFSDEDGVMVEPTACAVHAVLSADIAAGDTVAVVGAGTLGLAVVAALDHIVRPASACTVMVGAKHPHQQATAERLGADTVVAPDQLARAVRRRSGSLVLAGRLTNGADVVFDCVGTSESTHPRTGHAPAPWPRRARRHAGPGLGRPGPAVAPRAHRGRRLRLRAPGTELHRHGADARRTFDLAIDLVARPGSVRSFSAAYPLERYEEAIGHAGAAGRRGAVKVVFDLRKPKGRTR